MDRMTWKGSEVSCREEKGNREDKQCVTYWSPLSSRAAEAEARGPPRRGLARDRCQKLLEASVLFYKSDLLIKMCLFFGNTVVPGGHYLSLLRTRVHIS